MVVCTQLGAFVVWAVAAATPVGASAPSALQLPVEFACTPKFRYFCANVHVACAGRVDVATSPFNISLKFDHVRLTPAGGASPIGVEVASSSMGADGEVLLHFAPHGYLRVGADGTFVQRIRIRGTPVMAVGTCKRTEP